MPSNLKRINLCIPDALYQRLQVYKEQNGIARDATACLSLLTQRLNEYEKRGH